MPTREESKLEKLRKVYEAIDADTVSPDELVKAIEGVLAVVNNANRVIIDKVVANAKLSNDEIAKVKDSLKATERTVQAIRSVARADAEATVADVKRSLQAEIRRVRDLIPELPPETDLSGVEGDIELLQRALADIRFLITGENIRNSLEVLQGDDRLDRSAIRGLDDYEEIATLAREKSSGHKGWASSIAKITAGTGIAIDESDPRRPVIRATGGTGGGITVETPTGTVNAVNTSFTVTAEPQWIVSDGITYFDGAGYTYAALTVTLDVPPSQYIRAII